ncbi:eukaryotic initiation factor 2alpha kinase 1 [Plasmodium gaboni]|uniref:Eukaryotic initiation factor 2alpha kinase 1 n=1 Tax=Plasmodium gaboni TaxID=647221 RepID=A0ABY1UU44_9APIC|nr:eukaryotic initiation factor 2alpha kinase 1 [Plasmodium gaboni]
MTSEDKTALSAENILNDIYIVTINKNIEIDIIQEGLLRKVMDEEESNSILFLEDSSFSKNDIAILNVHIKVEDGKNKCNYYELKYVDINVTIDFCQKVCKYSIENSNIHKCYYFKMMNKINYITEEKKMNFKDSILYLYNTINDKNFFKCPCSLNDNKNVQLNNILNDQQQKKKKKNLYDKNILVTNNLTNIMLNEVQQQKIKKQTFFDNKNDLNDSDDEFNSAHSSIIKINKLLNVKENNIYQNIKEDVCEKYFHQNEDNKRQKDNMENNIIVKDKKDILNNIINEQTNEEYINNIEVLNKHINNNENNIFEDDMSLYSLDEKTSEQIENKHHFVNIDKRQDDISNFIQMEENINNNINDNINKMVRKKKYVKENRVIEDEKYIQDDNKKKKRFYKNVNDNIPLTVQLSNKGNEICKEIIEMNSRYYRDFYEEKILGCGGFGYVMKVKNKRFNITYALKIIRLSNNKNTPQTNNKHINEKDNNSYIMEEAIMIAKLQHENIVRYYDAWVEENVDFFLHKELQNDFKNIKIKVKSEKIKSEKIKREEIKNDEIKNEKIKNDEIKNEKTKDSYIEEIKYFWNHYKKSKDSSINDKYLYILMEYCPGKTLREAIDCGFIYRNEKLIWELIKQILKGISYIHDMKIMHRDIKPSNIFLQITDNILIAKIGDFGLTTRIGDTQINPSAGTIHYISPEQLNGEPFNEKADIFSLGVVFFEMFHEPFSTSMERSITLSNLLKGIYPEYMKADNKKFHFLSSLLAINPQERCCAYNLLHESVLFTFEKDFTDIYNLIDNKRNCEEVHTIISTLFDKFEYLNSDKILKKEDFSTFQNAKIFTDDLEMRKKQKIIKKKILISLKKRGAIFILTPIILLHKYYIHLENTYIEDYNIYYNINKKKENKITNIYINTNKNKNMDNLIYMLDIYGNSITLRNSFFLSFAEYIYDSIYSYNKYNEDNLFYKFYTYGYTYKNQILKSNKHLKKDTINNNINTTTNITTNNTITASNNINNNNMSNSMYNHVGNFMSNNMNNHMINNNPFYFYNIYPDENEKMFYCILSSSKNVFGNEELNYLSIFANADIMVSIYTLYNHINYFNNKLLFVWSYIDLLEVILKECLDIPSDISYHLSIDLKKNSTLLVNKSFVMSLLQKYKIKDMNKISDHILNLFYIKCESNKVDDYLNNIYNFVDDLLNKKFSLQYKKSTFITHKEVPYVRSRSNNISTSTSKIIKNDIQKNIRTKEKDNQNDNEKKKMHVYSILDRIKKINNFICTNTIINNTCFDLFLNYEENIFCNEVIFYVICESKNKEIIAYGGRFDEIIRNMANEIKYKNHYNYKNDYNYVKGIYNNNIINIKAYGVEIYLDKIYSKVIESNEKISIHLQYNPSTDKSQLFKNFVTSCQQNDFACTSHIIQQPLLNDDYLNYSSTKVLIQVYEISNLLIAYDLSKKLLTKNISSYTHLSINNANIKKKIKNFKPHKIQFFITIKSNNTDNSFDLLQPINYDNVVYKIVNYDDQDCNFMNQQELINYLIKFF